MDTSSILVMSIVLILLMMVLVFLVELLIPIQVKFEMNGICRGYIYKVESNGSLSSEEMKDLRNALSEIGLIDTSIEVLSEGSRFGDKVTLMITAKYKHNRLVTIHQRKEEALAFKYERTYFIRKIKN